MTAHISPVSERRSRITQQIIDSTGIDEAMIDRLVRAFYSKVRADDLIGPIFESRIQNWEPHLQRMCAFWSSVALMTGVYHGQPMRLHMPLPVDAQHFDRWLSLFEQTARELCPPAAADHFIERALRIARSLEMGIASTHGVLLRADQRFVRSDADSAAGESTATGENDATGERTAAGESAATGENGTAGERMKEAQ